ncbi:MAG: UspA domain protein [Candidatus Eremiobacteraeota bacterium]|nr:UspA domain protein [Candidatus Eremiobacteraeota bacterium]
MKPVFAHMTVPVDGSTTSDCGVTFALELARDGGRVSFCSVVDPSLVCVPAMQGAAVNPGPMLEVLDEDAVFFCRRAQDAAEKQGIDCTTQVLHGLCTDQIRSFAAHNGSDAIVIGTHGRTGIARAALGSIAEGIVRHSHVPVVCVHEDDEMRTGPVAVAMDQSPAAQAALDVAISIAAARGMASMIVYVCGPAPNAERVNALLENAAERARNSGIVTQLVLRQGDPADELLAAADEDDCCMLVMGTHGRSALARFVLGSVAAAVVERAHIPVVTVRCAA